MIFEAILSVKTLIFNNLTILSESTKLSKPRRDLLVEIMLLPLMPKNKVLYITIFRFCRKKTCIFSKPKQSATVLRQAQSMPIRETQLYRRKHNCAFLL